MFGLAEMEEKMTIATVTGMYSLHKAGLVFIAILQRDGMEDDTFAHYLLFNNLCNYCL